MATKLQKWGNSFAVRIPKELVQKLRLREGSAVEVREETSRIVIRRIPDEGGALERDAWKRFVIPTKRKKEKVSENIDHILYGVSSR